MIPHIEAKPAEMSVVRLIAGQRVTAIEPHGTGRRVQVEAADEIHVRTNVDDGIPQPGVGEIAKLVRPAPRKVIAGGGGICFPTAWRRRHRLGRSHAAVRRSERTASGLGKARRGRLPHR